MKAEFPRALHVEALEPCRLRIQWSTGETLAVDVAEALRRNPALKEILDPAVFMRAHAGEHGVSIEWMDSELGADNVYAWTREQMGEASHEMFYGWMARNSLSLEAAANALGMSRRAIAYYRSGAKPIPKHVWLACIGYETMHKREAA
ncbi:MAG: DUF2442 domain-containing protein [Gammaproteobacteria bacterium]|nr:DUF2442 domain-containing protein [Gammaproteobacteria bacterium]